MNLDLNAQLEKMGLKKKNTKETEALQLVYLEQENYIGGKIELENQKLKLVLK